MEPPLKILNRHTRKSSCYTNWAIIVLMVFDRGNRYIVANQLLNQSILRSLSHVTSPKKGACLLGFVVSCSLLIPCLYIMLAVLLMMSDLVFSRWGWWSIQQKPSFSTLRISCQWLKEMKVETVTWWFSKLFVQSLCLVKFAVCLG